MHRRVYIQKCDNSTYHGIKTIVARAFARISTDWATKGRLFLERRIVYEISWTFAAICKCVRQIEPMPDLIIEARQTRKQGKQKLENAIEEIYM